MPMRKGVSDCAETEAVSENARANAAAPPANDLCIHIPPIVGAMPAKAGITPSPNVHSHHDVAAGGYWIGRVRERRRTACDGGAQNSRNSLPNPSILSFTPHRRSASHTIA